MSFYLDHTRVLFLEYVHNCYAASQWTTQKNIIWDYVIIYNRRSRLKIDHFRIGQFIPSKPKY